ncbi:MAG TPA: hypothetical protein VKA68_04395 [bacterium]|nr:hypothetical protein [bacterium]
MNLFDWLIIKYFHPVADRIAGEIRRSMNSLNRSPKRNTAIYSEKPDYPLKLHAARITTQLIERKNVNL